MKKIALSAFALVLVGIASMSWTTKNFLRQKDSRPNIILIMADDLGFSDLGCFGGEIRTPNLDYLAQNGIRFTRFYNTSRCCPTRAALLTGLYNHQAGIGRMTENGTEPGYRGYLTENTVTLAEVLKSAGYQTAMSGKWHVSNTLVQKNAADQQAWLNHQQDFGDFSPLEQYPTYRGFDKFFGTIWGVIDFFDPFSLVNGIKPVAAVPGGYYHSDAINDTTAAYIRQMAGSDKPFFIYVAQNAPHWPLMAKPEDIARYKDTYKVGWEPIRQQRYERMVKMGLIDPKKVALPPLSGEGPTWEQNSDKAWDAEAMAVHAAMVDNMDQGIGRIIQALETTGELDNTVIFFLSDNGASPEDCAAYGPGFDRADQTRDGRKVIYATSKQALPGPQTTYASIGPRWASVANTPYRFWKAESYEGGVHTPAIAFWPAGMKAKKGSFSTQTAHVMDFMKTFLVLGKADYPSQFNGHQITPTSGISLVPALLGQPCKGHDVLFNEHFNARYAMLGNWKIVAQPRDSVWKLYNLAEDGSEMLDLAAKYPEKVAELAKRWKQWADTHNVTRK